ncbi:peptidase [Priestia endophytica]|uniref:Peptidase n=1 Tax=Priestia endophytica TaxID=135735 RepID=A0AAX1Q8T1_9BACI|nr:peptidase [Priestia endophytica]RAS90715.1 peptidase [Priestia endophytica]
MNLQDIKGSYDAVFSLGSACNPALQFQRLNLRRLTSSPLDWSYSPFLSDVNRLLKNSFKGFMELKNMRVVNDKGDYVYAHDGAPVVPDKEIQIPTKSYVIQDTLYNIFSAHDFPIIANQSWLVTYPSFKKTLNYRIYRFLKKVANSESVLFVRWVANYNEAVELQSILSHMVKGRFNVLILNPVEYLEEITEVDWGLDRTCVVNVPSDPNSDSTWDHVLNGVTLTN